MRIDDAMNELSGFSAAHFGPDPEEGWSLFRDDAGYDEMKESILCRMSRPEFDLKAAAIGVALCENTAFETGFGATRYAMGKARL